jgi:hypothetical protein
MNGNELTKVLDQVSRDSAREELVVLAVDIHFLITRLEEKSNIAVNELRDAVGHRPVRALICKARVNRLGARLRANRDLYKQVLKVAKMADCAERERLCAAIRRLKNDVRPLLGFNAGRLPWYMRSRLNDALLHL